MKLKLNLTFQMNYWMILLTLMKFLKEIAMSNEKLRTGVAKKYFKSD